MEDTPYNEESLACSRETNERLLKIEKRNKAFDDKILIVSTILFVIGLVFLLGRIVKE